MKFTTSFFNPTLYAKQVRRFWPLWAAYFAFWLFRFPLPLLVVAVRSARAGSSESFWISPEDFLSESLDSLSGGVILAALFGLLCAMAMFAYLYQTRSAYAVHALPPRREALFLTNYAAGLSFMLLPNLLVFLLTLLVAAVAGIFSHALPILLAWVLVQSASCLFFYSFAVFCAMFTGHIVALPVFYGILNFLASLLSYLLRSLCDLFLKGFVDFPDPVTKVADALFPLMRFLQVCDVLTDGEPLSGSALVLIGYSLAGVAFTVAALLLYRRRNMETAGDVIAVPFVRPLFRCGLSFCAGIAFGTFTAALLDMLSAFPLTLLIALFSVAAYFVAEMFIRKSFRVRSAWKGAVVMGAVMVLLCTAVTLDVTGFSSRIPKKEDVASIRTNLIEFSSPYDSSTYTLADLTDPDLISDLMDIHGRLIEGDEETNVEGWEDGGAIMSYNLTIRYTLTDGSPLERDYEVILRENDLARPDSLTYRFNEILQNQTFLEQSYNTERFDDLPLLTAYLTDTIDPKTAQFNEEVYLSGVSQEELGGLWQAVKNDLSAGRLGQHYLFETEETEKNTYITVLNFVFQTTPKTTNNFRVTLTPAAQETLSWLQSHRIFNERCQPCPAAPIE